MHLDPAIPAVRRAVIDVGTNSVKVLVADVYDHVVIPLLEESEQTRLGAGFFQTHRLQPSAIAHTARAVADFARTATAQAARGIRVIATSAARDALNQAELTTAITAASGLPVEILSGEQEADWAYRGVTTDPALANIPLLLLDVGGGSTEFILGAGSGQQFRRSFQLGTVRFLEANPLSDPPTPAELRPAGNGSGIFLPGRSARSWPRHWRGPGRNQARTVPPPSSARVARPQFWPGWRPVWITTTATSSKPRGCRCPGCALGSRNYGACLWLSAN